MKTADDLDELFETATLVQTGKVRDFPMILMGVDYWKPLHDALGASLLRQRAIDERDLDRLVLTDDVEEISRCIGECARRRFGIDLAARGAALAQRTRTTRPEFSEEETR